MSVHFKKASKDVEAKIIEWANRAVDGIASKSASLGISDLIRGLSSEEMRWREIVHDLESSRHLPDDRDIYDAEGVCNGITFRTTVDIVHTDEGVDRFGHTLVFAITTHDHEIEGVAGLPLPEEDGEPWVDVHDIANIEP